MLEEKPIRVCHLASGDLWAGAEVQISTLLRALKADPACDPSAVVLNRGRLAEEIAASGIPVTILDESKAGTIPILRSLVAYLNSHRPAILHSHRYKEHILGAFAARLSHNPVVVQTYHGLEENLKGWAAVKMLAYTWLNTRIGNLAAHGFIGVSEEIAEALRHRYRSGEVRCFHNGVDLSRVHSRVGRDAMREGLGLGAGEFVVGAVGRLTPIKGIEHLIRAWAICAGKSAWRRSKLVIVGDGPLRPSLEILARDLGVGADIVFLGHRTDVYDVMGMLDALVLPSLHEGIPMVLLEAMVLGVPIVASSVGGVPEILRDDFEARLVPVGDIGALADAIQGFAHDGNMRDRFLTAARARVEAKFSIDATAEKTRTFYGHLLSSVRAGA
jgi:glycosyltransferase involved in cell wall biosynthesis